MGDSDSCEGDLPVLPVRLEPTDGISGHMFPSTPWRSSMPPDKFSDAFRPLSHHLFPDGCPDPSLKEIWPRPPAISAPRRRRSLAHVTSSEQAQQSLQDIRAYAHNHRLSVPHICAVAWALHRMATATDLASVLVSDPRHFRDLLQSLLPRDRHAVSRDVVMRLLSIPGAQERSLVLRFLTLAIQTGDWLSVEAFEALTGPYLYARIFQAALVPATGTDAVRLLLRLTSAGHATRHRIRRIELVRTRISWSSKGDDGATKYSDETLSTLRSLLEGMSGDYKPNYEATGNEPLLADFPDTDWERRFTNTGAAAQEQMAKKLHGDVLRVLRQPPAYSGTLIDVLTSRPVHQALLLSQAERQRFQTFIAYALVPSHQDIGATVTQYQLQIELMRALTVCTRRSRWMPREIEDFVLESILPNWDGTESPWGTILCHELIPYVSPPKSFRSFRKRLLQWLVPHFLYGGARQQLLIVSAFRGIIEHWSMLEGGDDGGADAADATAADGVDHYATRTQVTELLRRLVLYIDDLILKAFLTRNGGDELLHMAAMEFYEAVSILHDRGWPFVGAPSPALAYRLLLAPSASSIDSACGLLCSFKRSFQSLKEPIADSKFHDAELAQDRIKVYNAFIWDYVSVLWTGSRPSTDAYDDRSILHNDLSIGTRGILEDYGEDSTTPLSVFASAAFAGYACRFLEAHSLQEPQQATKGAIRRNMKAAYLEELRQHGFLGIHSFLSTFVGSLANSSQPSAGTRG